MSHFDSLFNSSVEGRSHLDLVEVLSRIKRHHVVGGDADDGFVCRVLGPVKGQRRFTWNHLQTKQALRGEDCVFPLTGSLETGAGTLT